VIIRPGAEADVVSARDRYGWPREGLGAAFPLCVEEVLGRIGRTPGMCTAVYHDVRRALTRLRYAAYYRMAGTEVAVLGILQTRRDSHEGQVWA
jgi:hypothetical protein